MRLEKRQYSEENIDYSEPNYLYNDSQNYEIVMLAERLLPENIVEYIDFSNQINGYRKPTGLVYTRTEICEIAIAYGMVNSFYYIVGSSKEIDNCIEYFKKAEDKRLKYNDPSTEALGVKEAGNALKRQAQTLFDDIIDIAVENNFDTQTFRDDWLSINNQVHELIHQVKFQLGQAECIRALK